MDFDDLPRPSAGPLAQLGGEDLERFSIEALKERIAALEAEIARSRMAIDRKTVTKSAADALFKKS